MDGEQIETDVCVVGAGPAGITVALELAAHGVRTCLLDSGDRDPVPAVQRQSRGESDGYPIHALDRSRVRAFGGTLRHPGVEGEGWASRPLDPIDFEGRPAVGGVGWPFSRAYLDPYYLRAVRTFPMRSPEDAYAHWRQHASPSALDLVSDQLEAATFQFVVPSFDGHWQALSASPEVQVLMRTRVVDIVVDRSGRHVDRVVAVRGERERLELRPRLVVLAAGGIENARLLLTADAGRGVGNEHDLVGRYFSERLSFHGGHVLLADPGSIRDLAMLHRPRDVEVGGGLRVSERVQRERELLNCAFFLMPRPQAVARESLRSLSTLRKARTRHPMIPGAFRHVRNLVGTPLPLAEIAVGHFVRRPQLFVLRTQGEQAPHRDSRVTLGSHRDDLGIPVPRLTWRIDQRDFESIRTSASLIDAELRKRGIGHVVWTAPTDGTTLVEGNHHHLGTTRMHADPACGVVDASSRVHSVANLYVAGSSVFPTYGASNPTLTIIALSHRLADHLRERLAAG